MTNNTTTTHNGTTNATLNLVITQLLPSHGLLLTYALPLLLTALPVIFAGTYLTLDRTRYFVPLSDIPHPEDYDNYTAPPPKPATQSQVGNEKDDLLGGMAGMQLPGVLNAWEQRVRTQKVKQLPYPSAPSAKKPNVLINFVKTFRLYGGIGGLLAGFLLGVHIVTLLSSLPTPTHTVLNSGAFLALTILVSLLLLLLGARFHSFTLLAIPLAGAYGLGTILTLTLDPPLAARLILFFVSLTVLILPSVLSILPSMPGLPNPNSGFSTPASKFVASALFWTLRLSMSALGIFTFLAAIALLSKPPSAIPAWSSAHRAIFASVALPTPAPTSKDLALTIFGWILLPLGLVTDWSLHRFVGPANDQAWDTYLATYTTNLPDRAGHFAERPSLFTRLENAVLGNKAASQSGYEKPTKLQSPKKKPPFFKRYQTPEREDRSRRLDFDLERRTMVIDSPWDDDPDPFASPTKRPKNLPPLRSQHSNHVHFAAPQRPRPISSSSVSTLVEKEKESKLKTVEWNIDSHERDITSARRALEEGAWKPGFLELVKDKEKKHGKNATFS